MPTIRESDLPGIGRKFQLELSSKEKLVIVVHDSGLREMYLFSRSSPDECSSVIAVNDIEARQIAGILGGLAYKPKELEAVEIALDELVVEWYKVKPGSPAAGRTIGELEVRQRTGASIAALVSADQSKSINPGPDQIIPAGATLVVIGERGQIRAFRNMMAEGG